MGNIKVKTVTIVGTGDIGASWACLFLAHGVNVVATDIRDGAECGLREAVNVLRPSLADNMLRRTSGSLTFKSNLEEACRDADFVQENAIEKMSAKIDLIQQIDAVTRPDVVIASSSSAISVTDMQSQCQFPQRVVLGHPFNPPHLVPLVELTGGEKTTEEFIVKAEQFYSKMGKIPVRLKKEIYGHIANRMQAAIFREAIYLLESGVASAQDIDRAVSEGPGLRWACMGPFLTYYLAGGSKGMQGFWDKFATMQEKLWNDLGDCTPDTLLQDRVTQAVELAYAHRSFSSLSGDRDVFLKAVLAAKTFEGEV